MPEEDRRSFEEIAGPMLADLGYETGQPVAGPGS
jgi:hypothetical protein